MVVGKGLVANAFKTYKDDERYVVFASGVSNSTSVDVGLFDREQVLLQKTIDENPGKKLIYFSTCSIYDNTLEKSAYVLHKIRMENLIEQKQLSYTIFRISNLAGFSDNPNTVLNYFFRHIRERLFFQVWSNASRNIIDVDDAFNICDYIIKHDLFRNQIVNVANPYNSKVIDIVREIEAFLGYKGNYNIVEKTSNPIIKVNKIESLFNKLNLTFEESYLKKVIKKYYSADKV